MNSDIEKNIAPDIVIDDYNIEQITPSVEEGVNLNDGGEFGRSFRSIYPSEVRT